MDNSNNSNWPNNPPSSLASNPTPVSDPSSPFPSSSVDPAPQATPQNPTPPPVSPWDSSPVQPSFNQPLSTPATQPSTNPWDASQTITSQTPINPWETVPQSEPTQENPSTQTPQPTWVPPINPSSEQPLPNSTIPTIDNSIPANPQPEGSSPVQPVQNESEPAPTDLSHLISNNNQTDLSQNPSQESETLVVPTTAPDVSTTLPAENHKGIPKWLIGVGVVLLIMVTGASAYFILGIGQPTKNPPSIPASQESTETKSVIKTTAPIASPPGTAVQPVASDSSASNFGQLEGSSSESTSQATSAADLLRQRR